MLFSKNKPIQFKLAVFATTNRLTILDLHIFSGNIFECIDKGMQYYSSNIRWRADFVGKVQRGNIPEIPLIAIREILVNAFSHADYNSNTDFELDIYSDRVSIYSPGHFPKPYTPEMFVEQSLEPIPLNKTINNVLYKNGTIEQFSTGFERTFHECQKYHIQYDYTETVNGFRFTFYRPYAEKTKENFSEMEQKVLNLIQENEHITIKNMAQKCLVSDRTIQRIINKLKNKNLIIRMGDNKTGKWQIVK
ncbi:MAG: winged helix-turn-helix transcriptional regulator [Neisseriaceae bacterium]|nr:winged helix-turn-helix transcriptional regulator [Neisseriaceae bacterium]